MSQDQHRITGSASGGPSSHFWEAVKEGVFLLPRCNTCQNYYWYPRPICPLCLSADTDWVESKGRGRIYSTTVMRKAPSPYCIAYVELDEGPRLLVNITTDEPDRVEIGQRVEVDFGPSRVAPHETVAYFRPMTGHAR